MARVDRLARIVVRVRVQVQVQAAVDVVAGMSRDWLLGVSPLRGAGLLRCASSRCQRPSVSPLPGCHPSREHGQAGDAG